MDRICLSNDDLKRLGIYLDTTDPNAFVFKKVSDNGSNIKASWNTGDRWVDLDT